MQKMKVLDFGEPMLEKIPIRKRPFGFADGGCSLLTALKHITTRGICLNFQAFC